MGSASGASGEEREEIEKGRLYYINEINNKGLYFLILWIKKRKFQKKHI
jgi:hypothetical protein